MDFQNILAAVLVFGALVGINIFLFLKNKATPKPEGCEDLKADCEGCKDWSCMNNPHHAKQGE